MADGKKIKSVSGEKPTFDKQLDYSNEGQHDTDPIFSTAYHEFMSNLLRTRDIAIKDEFAESVAETLKPWYVKLDTIIANQKEQSLDLEYLKDMAKENRARIEAVEDTLSIHNRILEGHNTVLTNMKMKRSIELVVWLTLLISIITASVLIFHMI